MRTRIYENLGIHFKKLERNLYINKDADCVLIEGDGRDLSIIDDKSIDCIITDHPWLDKANKGGNRNFAKYDCFEYTLEDFQEKARVLKDGSFLVEVIPNESETNFDYLYRLKKMAQDAGFKYYCKVPWVKGTFKSNTGRVVKNREDLMIFSKGKPRALKWDKQRGLDENQFSGSGSVAEACINTKRKCILIEKAKDCVNKIKERLSLKEVQILEI